MTGSRTAVSPADRRKLLALLLKRKGIEVAKLQTIPKRRTFSPCALSFAQQRLWFLDRLQPQSSRYHISAVLRLRGSFSASLLRQAIGEVVRRHEILRTAFVAVDGEPMQVVRDGAAVSLPVTDLGCVANADREAEVLRQATAEVRRPFDLGAGPLLRTALLRLAPDHHVVVLVMHHIVSDGWSMAVLVRELVALYPAFLAGKPSPLPPLAVQYADFASWQREALRGDVLDAQLSYWRDQLRGAPARLELPTDRPGTARQRSRGAHHRFEIGGDLVAALRAIALEHRATLFTVMLAVWQIFLHRVSGEDDVIVGVPIANRVRVEIEPLIGFFVNTLVLRARFGDEPAVDELLGRVRETVIEAQAHQDLPFESLVTALRPDRGIDDSPLFRVMFTWQNTPRAELDVPGLALEPVPLTGNERKFDINLVVHEDEGSLPATFEYDADLFDASTMMRWSRHFVSLMAALAQGVAAGPPGHRRIRVGELPLFGAAERAQVVQEWSRPAAAGDSRGRSIVELFSAQVSQRPDAVAVVDGEEQASYGELDRRSGILARRLVDLGVGLEVPVGLFLERSLGLVTAMLAVGKAGGVFVPLDREYPSERLSWILTDTGAPIVVSEERLLPELPAADSRVLLLEDVWRSRDGESPPFRVESPGGDEALTYVMYTSGSTGKSKGVAVPQGGIVRLVESVRHFELGPDEVILQLASPAFDASTLETWGALLRGGRLIIPPRGPVALHELGRRIAEEGVTTLWLTAGLFHQVIETHAEILAPVRQLLAGGDALSLPHVVAALEQLPGTRLVNGYGPTENTTFSSCCVLSGSEPLGATVPIGTPIGETQVYLLDRRGRPVPIGVAGELATGGRGLARGYLGRPGPTAERFVPSPFAGGIDPAGARLYRTGDLARWRPDGRLDFLGRIDHQVKIRGFRIEPGEVEAALASHPAVRQAAVVVQVVAHGESVGEAAEKRLVAFVAAEGEAAPSEAALRGYLGERLPGFMVPAAIRVLPRLPLTPNGKVDRKALCSLRMPQSTAGTSPETRVEQALLGIWQDVLGRWDFGVEDRFFGLGGHSLSALRMLEAVRARFGREIPISELLRDPPLRQLAALLDGSDDGASRSPLTELHAGLPELEPLYLIHPVGGNVLCYSELTRALGTDHPVYAIEASATLAPPASLESLAAMYLDLIRRHLPDGSSFRLGGWSFGGLAAFEMARQASLEGPKVSLLVLLDPTLPDDLQRVDRLASALEDVFLADLIRIHGEVNELPIGIFRHPRSLSDRLQMVIDRGLLPKEISRATFEEAFGVFRRNLEVARSYAPKPYDGATALVQTRSVASSDWSAWIAPGARRFDADCHHYDLLRRPHVQALAGFLQALFREGSTQPAE